MDEEGVSVQSFHNLLSNEIINIILINFRLFLLQLEDEDEDVEENPTKKQKLQPNNAKSIGNNKASNAHKKKN